MPQPKIYDFTNYREFLRISVDHILKENPKLGHRGLSKKMGLSSPNFIQLVIQGKRNLSPETARKCSRLFDFNSDEATFFEALVGYNQATTTEDKLPFQRQMFSVKGYLRAKPVESAQFKYFSDLTLVVLRELIALKAFEPEPTQISKHFSLQKTSPAEVTKCLNLLAELRLVDRSLENRYSQRDTHLELPADLSHSFIFAFHKAVLDLAQKALMELSSKQREFSASTIPFNSERTQEAKEFLAKMQTEFVARFGSDPESDSVYQLNHQMFELAKISK